jgi:maltose/moltooligosaccharide transporter
MKPALSFSKILSMSMGFLGIQFGFALQNSNASRILQTFGADIEHLSWFWLAAPVTGLIVQPLIGHFSDKSWTRFGRRRPFFLAGAILASIALFLMPNAGTFAAYLPPMFVGAGFLMLMDASFNIAMEPFRALVGDMLPPEQTTIGFSIQSFLIGVGAVMGSLLPYMLAEWFGISKVAPEGVVPDNVVFSFYTGAVLLILTILWTVFNTREYSPDELSGMSGENPSETVKQHPGISDIFKSMLQMPKTMKQLTIVQFFTWISLFGMWVFTTPAIAQHVFGTAVDDSKSELYNNAGNWVGVLFGVYNAVGMIYALLIPLVANKLGRKLTHSISLLCGALGLMGVFFITDQYWLILPMIGIGIAWGSILSMPYAILAPSLPAHKMGVYMGIFNIFITLPQIVNGVFSGPMVKHLFNSQAVYALLISGAFMLIAAVSVLFVQDQYQKKQ